MICIVFIGNLIVRMVILLILTVRIMSHMIIIININGILLIMLIVVSSIFIFVSYYIMGDVSVDNFKLVKLVFLGLIVLILSSYNILMFLRWEGIRVISIILIRY